MTKQTKIDTVLFECTGCGRQHLGTDARAMPRGWDVVSEETIYCGDCAEQIEREHIDAKAAAVPDVVTITSDVDFHPEYFEASVPGYSGAAFTVAEPSRDAFHAHLQRQPAGGYLIAMAPAMVMALFNPMTFMLGADEAEATGKQLLQLAALARNPGSLGVAA